MNGFLTDNKDINDEIFWNYFRYQNPSFLAKDLLKSTQAKGEQLVNHLNDALINLRIDAKEKETSENENPNEIIDTVKKNFLALIKT